MGDAPPKPKPTCLHELDGGDDALIRVAMAQAERSLQAARWNFSREGDIIDAVGRDAWRKGKQAALECVRFVAKAVGEGDVAARAMAAVCVGASGFFVLIETRCRDAYKVDSALNDTLPINGVQDMDGVALAGAPKNANVFSLKGIDNFEKVKAALCASHNHRTRARRALVRHMLIPPALRRNRRCGDGSDQSVLGALKHALSQFLLEQIAPLLTEDERAAYASFKLLPEDASAMEAQMIDLGRISIAIYRRLDPHVRRILMSKLPKATTTAACHS